MAKRKRKQDEEADTEVAPAVRWFHAMNRGDTVMLALLTEAGPGAYSLSPVNASLMGDALRDAAEAASKQRHDCDQRRTESF